MNSAAATMQTSWIIAKTHHNATIAATTHSQCTLSCEGVHQHPPRKQDTTTHTHCLLSQLRTHICTTTYGNFLIHQINQEKWIDLEMGGSTTCPYTQLVNYQKKCLSLKKWFNSEVPLYLKSALISISIIMSTVMSEDLHTHN